ncbi:MAG: protein kinase [Deltaproteobacteria bacterium]
METQETARRTLAGRYTVEERLSTGGASRLYRARQANTHRAVVVREFQPYGQTAAEALAVFSRLAALHSRSLADVIDAGEIDDETVFVAHEELSGETLAERMGRRGVFPADEAAAEIARILKGLEALHLRDLVHGGLRPSRVFHERIKGRGWHVKLLSTGVSSHSREYVAGEGRLARYAPPEWLAGGAWLAPADVWVTGVLLFELLANRSPFAGSEPPQVVAKNFDPTSVATAGLEAPTELLELIASALHPDPSLRPATAAEMLDHLVAIFPQPDGRASTASIRRHWTQGKFVARPAVPLALPPVAESRTSVARRHDKDVISAQWKAMAATAFGAAVVFGLWQWHPWRVEGSPLGEAPARVVVPVATVDASVAPDLGRAPVVQPALVAVVVAAVSPVDAAPAVAVVRAPGRHTGVNPPAAAAPPRESGQGMLAFRVANPCTLYLDGEPRGHVSSLQLPLSAGSHEIVCRSSGATAQRVVVHIREGSVTRVRIGAMGEAEISTDAPTETPPPG